MGANHTGVVREHAVDQSEMAFFSTPAEVTIGEAFIERCFALPQLHPDFQVVTYQVTEAMASSAVAPS